MSNSEILQNLDVKLSHLEDKDRKELSELILEFSDIFPDVPTRTSVLSHDVDVGDTQPIKQHPYRVNQVKRELIKSEVDSMLENKIIQPSHSPWSSPCVMIPKSDGSIRFCTDFRKVNAVTKGDSFPIPRIDDCIDRIGSAKYVTKLDMMKGYWAVPLTERAREVSAFATPDGLYEYLVMPFGMKNSGASYQRLVNQCVGHIDGVEVYVDDVAIHSDTWEKHLIILRKVFWELRKAGLTGNLRKSDFGKAKLSI